MKTAKKILAGILAMTTLFSVGFTASCKNVGENAEHNAFIKELGGTSETYTGAVSKDGYSTEEAAARACVSNEISSYSTGASIATTKKLNSSQILQLNLPKTETAQLFVCTSALVAEEQLSSLPALLLSALILLTFLKRSLKASLQLMGASISLSDRTRYLA